MSTPNELRVFISSTFRDLQEEREHLMKKIFPEIRSLCRERGIRFTEVDLRWGLTDEDIALGQVIRTCLDEVDKCRPYFIGITGDRYGFVPSYLDIQKDPLLLEQHPWIEDAAIAGMSITEMEAQYAVLNPSLSPLSLQGEGPGARSNALFCFRRHRKSIDDDHRDDEEWRRLEAYQQRIEASDARIEHFRDPGTLGEMIYDDLIEIIKRDFADAKPPTPLEQERMRHEAFSLSRRRAYIANPSYLKRLNEHAASDDPPLVVYAESGSGKSSLFAFWADQYRRKNPDVHVIEHHVGIGATATDRYAVIRHICMEINERFGRKEEIPSESSKLEHAFGQWLGYADHDLQERGQRMVVILDGLNQLQGTALNLRWIPDMISPSIRLILSSTVEGTLVELKNRGWSQFGMQALSEAERETIVVRYLAEYHKSLNAEQIKRLATDYKCGHPLFLKTVLEELRLIGRHEELDAKITSYLNATGTEDLFQRVLERFEDDYSQRSVRDLMTLLSASRSGLDERELSEISGIARLKIATMTAGLDYHLVRKEGHLTFFHDYLRRAIEKRYLSDEQKKRATHKQLAEYFERSEVTLRATRELLHALEMLGDRERIARVLSEVERFVELWKSERYEVLRLWSTTEPSVVTAEYRAGLQRWRARVEEQDRGSEVGIVADLLASIGEWQEAQALQVEQLELAHERGDLAVEAAARIGLGWLLKSQGDYEAGFAELSRARDLYDELGNRRGLLAALASLGIVYADRGEHGQALEYFRQEEAICRELGDRGELAVAIHNIGWMYDRQGKHREGMEQYEQALEINRSVGNRVAMTTNLRNMGGVYLARGDDDRALECFRQQEAICRELGDRPGLAGIFHNVGMVYQRQQKFSEAMVQYEAALEINQRIGNRYWMAHNLSNIGQVYSHRGEYDRAIEYYHQAETIYHNLGHRDALAGTIGNIGNVYVNRGEYDGALECYRQIEAIFRELGDRWGVSITIGNIGATYAKRGEHEHALECFWQAVQENRDMGYRHGLTEWLQGAALMLVELVEAGNAEMPEYLTRYVPDATVETWRATSLLVARQHAEESIAIAAELSLPSVLYNGQVALARITAAAEDVASAAATLRALLEEANAHEDPSTRDERRAELHYRLWKLNATEEDHRGESLRLYEALLKQRPLHEHRKRIEELIAAGNRS